MKRRIITLLCAALLLCATAVQATVVIDSQQAKGQEAAYAFRAERQGERLVLVITDRASGKEESCPGALRQDGRLPCLTLNEAADELVISYAATADGLPAESYHFVLDISVPGGWYLSKARCTFGPMQIGLEPGKDWLVLMHYKTTPGPEDPTGYVNLLRGMAYPGMKEKLPIGELDADALAGQAIHYYKHYRAQARVQVFEREFERLKLRDKPSRDGAVLGQYYSGVVVSEVLEKGGQWTKVRIGSQLGYMMTDFLEFDPLLPQWSQTQAFGGCSGRAQDSGLMMHEQPDKQSSTMLTLPDDAILVVLGTVGEDWLHVAFQPELPTQQLAVEIPRNILDIPATYGFVFSRSVVMTDNYATCQVDTGSAGDRLHLRAAPSTSAPSLGRYYAGTEFRRLFDDHVINDGFERVRLGSMVGYVKDSLLSYSSNRLPILPPLSRTIKEAPLLAEASKQAAVLQKLPKGSRLQVLGAVGTYYQVSLSPGPGGTLGFVSQQLVQPVKAGVSSQVTVKQGAQLYEKNRDGSFTLANEQVRSQYKLVGCKALVYDYILPNNEYVNLEIILASGESLQGFWLRTEDLKIDPGLIW